MGSDVATSESEQPINKQSPCLAFLSSETSGGARRLAARAWSSVTSLSPGCGCGGPCWDSIDLMKNEAVGNGLRKISSWRGVWSPSRPKFSRSMTSRHEPSPGGDSVCQGRRRGFFSQRLHQNRDRRLAVTVPAKKRNEFEDKEKELQLGRKLIPENILQTSTLAHFL